MSSKKTLLSQQHPRISDANEGEKGDEGNEGSDGNDDLFAVLRSAGLLRSSAGQKRRGQNFLRDANCARRIARCCDVAGGLSSSLVVEIGAGAGSLTRALFREGALRVVAIESDARFVDFLEKRSATLRGGGDKGNDEGKILEVVEGDARTLDYSELVEQRCRKDGSLVIVGNLPYRVGTVILQKILNDGVGYGVMVLMFQREVAERMTAGVGDAAYGRLSVLVGLRCRVERCFDVAPSVFVPAPKVFSCVLRFFPRGDGGGDGGDGGDGSDGGDGGFGDVSDADYRVVEEMTGLLFSYRRKRMSTTLRMAGREDWGVVAEGIGIDCSRRAEELGMEAWLRWAQAVRAIAQTL